MKTYAEIYGERAALFLELVFKAEGGFVNDPQDTGGQTMRGVTYAVFKECLGLLNLKFKTEADAIAYHARLSEADAAEIYVKRFWLPTGMHTLPNPQLGEWAPLAISVADHQVNAGSWGVRGLQRLVGVTADGQFGPLSLKATVAQNPKELFTRYQNWRRSYYSSIQIAGKTPAEMKAWHARFGKGLQNRVSNLERDLKKRGVLA